MAGDAQVVVEGFPVGTKVALRERNGDWAASGAGKTVARSKVGADSRAVFDGLPEDGAYWAESDSQAIAVTAKPVRDAVAKLSEAEAAEALSGTLTVPGGDSGEQPKLPKGVKAVASHTAQGEVVPVDLKTGEPA